MMDDNTRDVVTGFAVDNMLPSKEYVRRWVEQRTDRKLALCKDRTYIRAKQQEEEITETIRRCMTKAETPRARVVRIVMAVIKKLRGPQ